MDASELLAKAGDQLGVHRVFGEPIERDGTVVIPVATVMGGGGGGMAPGDEGSGGGFGVWTRGIGVYTIRDGHVRFVPALDAVALGFIGLVLARTLARLFRKQRRRHRRREH